MSQHVGFYEVITDQPYTLTTAQGSKNSLVKPFSFTPPPNTATDNAAVLNFMLHVEDAKQMVFKIDVNGVSAVYLPENGSNRSFVQEVLNPNPLKPGQVNSLVCTLQSGTGTLSFSDMVIAYQRNV
jgi:hypothetical protein